MESTELINERMRDDMVVIDLRRSIENFRERKSIRELAKEIHHEMYPETEVLIKELRDVTKLTKK